MNREATTRNITAKFDRIAAVEYDECGEIECPCCGRSLKWLYTFESGFAGGSGCARKHLGITVKPSAFNWVADYTRKGWVPLKSTMAQGDKIEIWGTQQGQYCALVINSQPVTTGPDKYIWGRYCHERSFA